MVLGRRRHYSLNCRRRTEIIGGPPDDGRIERNDSDVPRAAGTRADPAAPDSRGAGLPDWFKAMPQKGYSVINQKDLLTIKKCPPVVDAMAYGFCCRWPAISRSRTANFPGTARCRAAASPACPTRRSIIMTTCRSPARRFRRRPLHHQIQQFLDHRNTAGLLAAVHASAQPHRSAVHDHHRTGRHRQLHRQPDQYPGALARYRIQRRAAEGHAGRAMHPGQA